MRAAVSARQAASAASDTKALPEGGLALELLALLQRMAAPGQAYVSPSTFVAEVRARNALFAGFEQHVRYGGEESAKRKVRIQPREVRDKKVK